jgi:cellulose biosynthesis protein BcsQ
MKTQSTLFIAFASQKGGVGKTTFTSLVASALHYRYGFNIVVMDCDYPQYSLVQMRERDMRTIMEHEAFKKMAHQQFTTLGKKAYPIISEKPETALEVARDLVSVSPVPIHIVFFDLPGTVNTPGIIKALTSMDFIFTPIIADRVVMESTLVFTQLMTEVLMKQQHVSIKGLHLFWNQVDGRERNTLYEHYNATIGSLGLSLMDTSIAASVRFRKENEADSRTVFRSTLLPADDKLMQGCNLDKLIEEVLEKIKLQGYGEK